MQVQQETQRILKENKGLNSYFDSGTTSKRSGIWSNSYAREKTKNSGGRSCSSRSLTGSSFPRLAFSEQPCARYKSKGELQYISPLCLLTPYSCRLDGRQLFYKPVSKTDVPDYHVIVKSPMDWQTMYEKLDQNAYVTAGDFQVL